ncbi:MAG: Asp-tRNA(Asn)/Glu-tRNA(Gln) amidotransferase subunit GatA [Candidatus Omnitrophica bacterium]|nr:Asp-tRNA(Asn)/Glu-tRNA(Gln) amidotransferase subunit GatA [Candidatus Omnitrophota bacterium]
MAEGLYKLTACKIRDLIEKKEISVDDVVGALTERIQKTDKKLNALISLEKADLKSEVERVKQNKGGALYGVPVAIKDNICVDGRLTTCASNILEGFRPPYNATVIDKLREKGALICGRANMDEFAFGSSCETSCYGPTRNPWDTDMIPGGSSGGSASSVAADEAIAALGSDTGGSIRQPAALCGVVGMKPTYGRVSRYGLIAFASSLDQIGPITKDVSDCALLLNAISGYDPKDSTSVDIAVPDYTKSLKNDIKGMRIAIPKEYFVKGIDKEVKAAVLNGIKTLESLGAKCDEVSLPHTEYAVSTYYIIAPAEASSNLARFDGVQYGLRKKGKSLIDMYKDTRAKGFGSEAKRRVILGTYVLSSGYYDAYYLKALKVRTKLKEDFDKVFKDFACIVTPTSPTPAFKIGERIDDPLSMYLSDIFTIPANLTGIPGISIPCGFTKKNLPIGLQILAKPFNEETLIRTAYTFEENTDFHKRKPDI